MRKILALTFALPVAALAFTGCSHPAQVQKDNYAALKNRRTFEYDFATVWNGIETAMRNQKVVDRDPDDVSPTELRNLRARTLETDWVFGQSRDKYVEYKINDVPKRRPLQTRIKYKIKAQGVMGGTEVVVDSDEEIERLNDDGSPAGYSSVDNVDTSRQNELLDKIQMAILSAAP